MPLPVPYERQILDYTCGPRSLKMVLGFLGRDEELDTLIRLAGTTPSHGTTRRGMLRALRTLGLQAEAWHGASLHDLRSAIQAGTPPIVNHRDLEDDFGHYSVVVAVTDCDVVLHDPWHGPKVTIAHRRFLDTWHGHHRTQFTRWLLIANTR